MLKENVKLQKPQYNMNTVTIDKCSTYLQASKNIEKQQSNSVKLNSHIN